MSGGPHAIFFESYEPSDLLRSYSLVNWVNCPDKNRADEVADDQYYTFPPRCYSCDHFEGRKFENENEENVVGVYCSFEKIGENHNLEQQNLFS